MAAGKAGYGINVGANEGVGEGLGVEILRNPGDVLAGVKVQVDLAETQFGFAHGS